MRSSSAWGVRSQVSPRLRKMGAPAGLPASMYALSHLTSCRRLGLTVSLKRTDSESLMF